MAFTENGMSNKHGKHNEVHSAHVFTEPTQFALSCPVGHSSAVHFTPQVHARLYTCHNRPSLVFLAMLGSQCKSVHVVPVLGAVLGAVCKYLGI